MSIDITVTSLYPHFDALSETCFRYPVYVAITPLGGPVLLAIMIVFGLFVTLISILMARWPTPHVFSQDAREGHLRFHLARVRYFEGANYPITK